MNLQETWNPKLVSFIESAQGSDFPIQHLPLGIFKPQMDGNYRVGVAIGHFVLDLAMLDDFGLFDEYNWARKKLFNRLKLNRFMALGRKASQELRCRLVELLSADNPDLRDHQELRTHAFHRMEDITMSLPVEIGDYTDFYSSKEHATNVGIMFRGKDNALQPNWLHLPVGYHGRASTIVKSGTPIVRPSGQTKSDTEENPSFGACRLLDFELEMGFFIGSGNKMGEPISINDAEDHIWGMVVVNDWSARDIQKWEYVPLGPFLAKNFATSISPWVVTMEALEPFRTPGPVQNPKPLAYLDQQGAHAFDIKLDVSIKTSQSETFESISSSNFKYLYWSMAQQLAHHTSSGCEMRTGDLLASGTISGPTPDSYGSLLELTWRGASPITLKTGEQRTFLKDGDSLRMSAFCQNENYRIGFGEVVGEIVPAVHVQ
ncbi:fumarylacetoacetase [bacterium]|nr:MAG: fumarylacetoacetase [bacterium]